MNLSDIGLDGMYSRSLVFGCLKNNLYSFFSVPTPSLTDAITVAWDPLSPTKNQIYRINEKPSMDVEHKQDALK